MPGMKHSNKRYRTKENMAHDVAFILTAPVEWGTKYDVINGILWAWNGDHGKYDGCEYWSKKALESKNDPKVKRIHEHIVPRKALIGILERLADPTPDKVRQVLNCLCVAAVIANEEHSRLDLSFRDRMPNDFVESPLSASDPWLRYKRCGIDVVNCRAGRSDLQPAEFLNE